MIYPSQNLNGGTVEVGNEQIISPRTLLGMVFTYLR